jgi:hypothetical protein
MTRTMSTRTILLAAAGGVLLMSCGRPGPIERKIAAKIAACKGRAPCRLVMSDITDFDWDRVFSFAHGATKAQVEAALGTAPPQFTEFTRKIVFMNQEKVVYMEEDPTDIERPSCGQVAFGIPDHAVYRAFTRQEAVFLGEQKGVFLAGQEKEECVYCDLRQAP